MIGLQIIFMLKPSGRGGVTAWKIKREMEEY
jgi:hypothetical protein